jgi:co-chaperonin GroES (HSP10)
MSMSDSVEIDPIVAPAPAESETIRGALEPTGYRVLVRIPNLPQQMERWGKLYMPETTHAVEESAQLIAQVVALGPDAYADKEKFPTGAWCAPGDVVVIRAYAGTRFTVGGHLYALINDDTVQAVVRGNPADIERP